MFEDLKCPNCNSSDIEMVQTEGITDISVVYGDFRPPFHWHCNSCNHDWYLIDDSSEDKENFATKKMQRLRALIIFIILIAIPFILSIIFHFVNLFYMQIN